MEKFILIDGNSLLNRAYYAMGVFSTKDGLPTNGIFGFIKLIFKILEDRNPKYFAVAFDVHAPTFRHKMYDGYKATRKPMPEELAQQIPVLKELLTSMNIRIVEKAGYEADDVIGTLSRKFDGVEVYIYTGDRDSYQLVNDNVSICFTRRGVSELDLLTKNNFYEKVKLEPFQIIEEKSLMGDSSDNIPGVKGIGAKTALALLQKYGTLDEIYNHIDEITSGIKGRLESDKEIAYLSHKLATIDTEVPLDVTLESCKVEIPFPQKARELFQRLEFRSLINADFFEKQTAKTEYSVCSRPDELLPLLNGVKEFAFYAEKEGYHLYFGGKEFYFPFRKDILAEGIYPDDIKPLLEGLFLSQRVALVPDVKATIRFLEEFKIKAECRMEDVMLLRYLGNSDLRPIDPKELTKEFSLPETECAYALKLTYDDALKKMNGTEEEKLYRELELPLAYVLLDMENTGVHVDEDKFSFFREKFNGELKELSEKIFALAGESFNLNSPFKLSEILFVKLGFNSKGLKKNIRGGFSTNAEVLEKLAEEHEIARLILRYREIQKLVSTYVDGIAPLVKDGAVHTTYNQTMTTTGRLSSANPNLQNIPVHTEEGKELRKLFVAQEGNILIDADYSQIELRLLAHFSGAERLIKAYNEGADIHSETASQVFGVTDVTPQMRRAAKVINFGIIYGMGAYALSKDLNCSVAEAQAYIERYFNRYPEVKTYMEENVRRAKEDGFVVTILGRRRYITELKSPNVNIRTFGERAARNMPLQGSAADIIKIAMLRVFDRLQKEGLKAKMVLQVHDELMLDCPLAEQEKAAKILKEEMENAVRLNVPLIAEVSTGKSWYEAK
ncbi:MAG: DNA polymerase I [Clostridia bacterium]|nr:DNA polymerase I [Clostridia bacterium]